ncbi:FtsQ-type POTRA domain-containing protein [Microbacterium sp. NPDC057407]|uniref:FtsQ-type POTRA domain-containing protein n=1 Tax=Microbacterium sp. NPDC057407 TaxID=3346120 RepID=UPI00366ECF1E
MRRPSPLPPPAREQSKPATAGRADRRVVAEADAARADDGEPDATAPVIPLGAATPTAGATGGAAGARPVGWRDVWAARRARRKALRAEVRRFTARQRRRRAVLLGAAGAVLLLALGTLGAAYSPLFAVETITVVGAQQLDDEQVASALSDQLGTPMPLVDESAVKAALVGFPLVESYTLEARPPHELVVRLVERTPIGVIDTRAGFTVVDAAGVALATAAAAPSGLPLLDIRGGVESDAFIAAGQVMHSLPDDIRTQVTAVSATTADDVTLTLGATGSRVVWGSAEQSAQKAMTLEMAMVGNPPQSVSVYDVSSPSAVVVR